MKYCIGDTVVEIDMDEDMMHPNFKPFLCEDTEEAQMKCYIAPQDDLTEAYQMTLGQMTLMHSGKLEVYEGASGIDLLYPLHRYLTSIRITKDRTEAKIYVMPDQEEKWKEELYAALRDVIYVALEENGRFAMDSSSILYQGRAVLFAADPEAKLAALCQQQGLGERLNDEVNICGIQEDRIYVYGTPWSGNSYFQPERKPMGGIVFVKKSDAGEIVDLSADKRQLLMLVRCVSPFWREGLLDQCLNPIQRIEPSIWIRQLQSTVNDKAVELLEEEFTSLGW